MKEREMFFRLSASQHTPAGNVLEDILYGDVIGALLKKGEWTGCPHDGGSHSLSVTLTPSDASAFINLVEERLLQLGEKRFLQRKYAEGIAVLRGKVATKAN